MLADGLNLTSSQVNKITYNWVDMDHIIVSFPGTNNPSLTMFTGGGTGSDGIASYWARGGNIGYTSQTCGSTQSTVNAEPYDPGAPGNADWYYSAPGSINGGCLHTHLNTLSIGDTSNARILFTQSGLVLNRVDGNSGYSFTQSSTDPDLYLKTDQSNQECADRIVLNDPSDTTGIKTATLYALTTGTSGNFPSDADAQGCAGSTGLQSDTGGDGGSGNYPSSATIYVSITQAPKSTLGQSSSSTSSSGAQQQQIGLTCNLDINPLTWLICPIVTAANELIGVLDTQITTLLDINGCQYFNPSTSPDTINTVPTTGQACSNNNGELTESEGYYIAWENLRTIAIGVVVIVALVMIIAQALGFELFDAYTVKKVLPRMLIAVIGISLSWQLVQLFIQVSDDLGVGVRYLIYEPFLSLGTIQVNQTGSSALALIGGLSLLGLGLFGLLSFVLVAALAVIVAFVLLTFREMLIIFLAIFAPVAIACFILPGTQKVWKFWWENFSKALLMFPIITAFIAIGRVFAVSIAGNNEQGAGVVQEVTAMVAYFGPYFLIPFTFKMAGSILSTAGNLASSLQKAANKPLANYRRRKLGENWNKLKAGQRFPGLNDKKLFGRDLRRINEGLKSLTTPSSLLPGKYGMKGQSMLGTTFTSAVNEGIKALQTENLQDDEANNEFTIYGDNLGMLQGRVKYLNNNGQADLGTKLSMYAKYAGRRDMQAAAMKLNASFGKVSDGAMMHMNSLYGDSLADKQAKQAAFGDVIFTSKNAGNWVTYSSYMDKDGKVRTLSEGLADSNKLDADGNNILKTVKSKIANNMLQAGPGALGSIKPYKDKTNASLGDDFVYDTKTVVAEGIAAGAQTIVAQRDPAMKRRAVENLAQASAQGAYNDPAMKAALDNAARALDDSTVVPEFVRPMRVKETDANGVEREVIRNVALTEKKYYEYLTDRMSRGNIDPRTVGLE